MRKGRDVLWKERATQEVRITREREKPERKYIFLLHLHHLMLQPVTVLHHEREMTFLLISLSLLLSLTFFLLAWGPIYPGNKIKWGRRKGPRYSIL